MMKEGKVSLIIDWNKVLYGAFSLAFLLKGVALLNR
jgi:hypothetical protein